MDVVRFVRMAPLPFTRYGHRRGVDIHFFFVPARLVWDNWKYFMGETRDAWDSSVDYEVPARIY